MWNVRTEFDKIYLLSREIQFKSSTKSMKRVFESDSVFAKISVRIYWWKGIVTNSIDVLVRIKTLNVMQRIALATKTDKGE